ncbi:helix-turn-helix transcriptional regulator [Nonomuraea sp. H19]|uniref:helix-turn-helix transcriptional regulator n=1 Tax=Nonomuraea sp. H19 TaxID=3452206 RepID=UPI003F896002
MITMSVAHASTLPIGPEKNPPLGRLDLENILLRPAVRWQGWAAITPDGLYYGGQIGATDMHAHHAAQLLIGDRFVLRDAEGAEHVMTAALIPANAPHAIVHGTVDGLLALIDPVQAGPMLDHSCLSSAVGWHVDLNVPAGRDLPTLQALVDHLTGTATPCPRHPALIHAIQVIAAILPMRVRLAEVACAVNLSESRLSHLFTSELGLPFRPYVLWMRLRAALSALSDGALLTEAAHVAGFADAAHLSRTFRRMGSFPKAR